MLVFSEICVSSGNEKVRQRVADREIKKKIMQRRKNKSEADKEAENRPRN